MNLQSRRLGLLQARPALLVLVFESLADGIALRDRVLNRLIVGRRLGELEDDLGAFDQVIAELDEDVL